MRLDQYIRYAEPKSGESLLCSFISKNCEMLRKKDDGCTFVDCHDAPTKELNYLINAQGCVENLSMKGADHVLRPCTGTVSLRWADHVLRPCTETVSLRWADFILRPYPETTSYKGFDHVLTLCTDAIYTETSKSKYDRFESGFALAIANFDIF